MVDDNPPRRVLIISAEMGEGHNAAAAALTEAIEECWPDCSVARLDTMELRGVRFAKAARWAYGFQLSVLPWSYAIFYAWLSRSRRFAALARRGVGAFFGRRLAKAMDGHEPDLVISTYPFGSAALDWLRRTRGFSTLTVTYIPAFHVHPLWAYDGIDLHFVMYDGAVEHALLPGFEQSVRLGSPPVLRGFGEIGRGEARRLLGLPEGDFVVLMTGGAWGLGEISGGVEALVELEPPVHVVAVCGKNSSLEAEMRSLAMERPGRLTAYGYVSTMPELMAAANVVVTNGAGVTVLEALRTPRPVVAFAPLAGHGTFSTLEMVKRNLAVEARNVPGLVQQIRRLRTDQGFLHTMESAGESWVEGRDLRRSVGEIQAVYSQRWVSRGGEERSALRKGA
ncbi:MAG TPA: glycosyltransferase [Acidimicrobiales bacterium]|nr:glycosyltransferase [Acidimicrobiales bacterium]